MKTYKHPNYSYITIVEIPKDEIQKVDMSLCAQPTQTLKAYYDACEVKPTIICNGGFFGMANGHTCFNYIDEGKVINVNGETEEGFGIYNNELVYGFVKDKKYTDFISAYPMLIKDGKKADITIANEINYKARRSILAYNETTIFIIAVEGSGMTFSQMQDFLLKMNIDYALNLDGGGSTKILENGKSITSSLYNRAVDNVIAIYLKPKTIYRVQAGAFSFKMYADALLEKIHALGGDYKSAYVRKINGYWKVQMGAFGIKDNAERMLKDLVSKGFNAFITTI